MKALFKVASICSLVFTPVLLILPLFTLKELTAHGWLGPRLAYRLRQKAGGYYIGATAQFADRPFFPHGYQGINISGDAEIGERCVIFQQVTIGSNTLLGSSHFGSPTIGNDCYIGAGAKIVGKVSIGDNCRIGANAVVYKDVPPNSTVVSGGMRITPHHHRLDNRFCNYGSQGFQYWDGKRFRPLDVEDVIPC